MASRPLPPLRMRRSSSSSTTFSELQPPKRKLRLLVAASGPRDVASWAQALIVRLSKNPLVETRAVADDVIPRLTQTTIILQNQSFAPGLSDHEEDIEFYRQQAFDLVQWADLMVCLPLDADGISKMLAGIADTLMSEVLRGWDTHKNIVLVPGMSTHMWENPTTKRQLSKLHRKWKWVKVMNPITWYYEGHPTPRRIPSWGYFTEVLSIIKHQTDLLELGNDLEILPPRLPSSSGQLRTRLPPEIWSLIFDCSGDWELAKAVGVYTTLPMPSPWTLYPKDPDNDVLVYEHELEWTVLTCDSAAICKKLSQSPQDFRELPAQFIRLVIRFALIDVLSYLEANRPDLFRVFEDTLLPTRASASYPRTEVLNFWKNSRRFRDKHMYDAEAVDVASQNGHVRILDWWWRESGFPLRYTETALEQASANGHIPVLEWWRDAAAQDENVVLRPGRSLLWAAQYGHSNVLRWWDESGIPVAHGDAVAKVASSWGRVEALETWRLLKGDEELVFDSDVLVAPTVHQHVEVLEWWRRFAHGELEGMRSSPQFVEFRTCTIEEALDESMGDQARVRAWWAQNGLSPEVRSQGWMKMHVL